MDLPKADLTTQLEAALESVFKLQGEACHRKVEGVMWGCHGDAARYSTVLHRLFAMWSNWSTSARGLLLTVPVQGENHTVQADAEESHLRQQRQLELQQVSGSERTRPRHGMFMQQLLVAE